MKMTKATSRSEARIGICGIFVMIGLIAMAKAQTAEIPHHLEPYVLNSGVFTANNETALVYSHIIDAGDVPWVRLMFSDYNLGSNSYLIMTSLKDGGRQRLNANSMQQWQSSSAYFNGNAVKIDLYVVAPDVGVFIQMEEIVVGEWVQGFIESQCGPTDDRLPSNDPAVGRIVSIGCTGWIITNGKNITAGHCLDGSGANVLEFNVPLSLPGGSIQHPGPEDQYAIDQSSRVFINGGIGNDFGVFTVFDNSVTGLQPIEAQNAAFFVVQSFNADSIRITGYGVDSSPPEWNQTQQTHVGPDVGSSGTTMRYQTDTEGGNSGSPVIDAATGYALGVHTHGGCTTSGSGNNSGTSAFHTAFWAAIGTQGVTPAPPDTLVPYSDYTTPTTMLLTWEDPHYLFNGDTLLPGDFKIQIKREGVWIDSVDGGVEQYVDNGLVDGVEYTYEIYAKLDSAGFESQSISASWIAGGSPIPNPPVDLGISHDQNQVTIYWTNPVENIDGTPMDDFAGVNVYQDNSLLMSLARSSADTSQSDSVTFTPSTSAPEWYISAFDNENPSNESAFTGTLIIPLNVPVLENFAIQGLPNPAHWQNWNADVNDRGLDEPSDPYSLNFNGMPSGGDTVESYPIDLSNAQGSGVVFSYFYQPQGTGNAPETGDSLQVHFKNDLGEWVLVRGYPGTPVQDFQHEVIDIETAPNGGGSYLYSQFQIRIKSRGSANQTTPNDDWFVDNIYLGLAAPAIASSQDSVLFDTTLVGDTSSIGIQIHNVGVESLVVSQVLGSGGIFSVDVTSFTVDVGSGQEINVSFSPQAQGNYSGWIRFVSNDPVNDTLSVYVEGSGKQVTGIVENEELPRSFGVSPNYPNPFNPTTTIKYQLPHTSEVKLTIYNVLGQAVRRLVDARVEAGYHSVEWDGSNDVGAQVASGIYIYRFSANNYLKVQKMILMK
jgi:hypothetical protein